MLEKKITIKMWYQHDDELAHQNSVNESLVGNFV